MVTGLNIVCLKKGVNMKIRLTKEQEIKKDWIIEQMGDNFKPIDLPIVENLAFALDRLAFMDSQINDIASLLSDKVYMSSREKMIKQVNDSYKMLGITAQERNKANIDTVKQVENKDPLEALIDV